MMKKDDCIVDCGGIQPEPLVPSSEMSGEFVDPTLAGNECIEAAIHQFYQEQTEHRFMGICMAVRNRIAQDGHLLFDESVCTLYDVNLESKRVPGTGNYDFIITYQDHTIKINDIRMDAVMNLFNFVIEG